MTNWNLEHAFDAERSRHELNGKTSVLHCHHYATLYCQLAADAQLFDGKALLVRACELSFHQVLSSYFAKHEVESAEERIALAEDYWRLCGMGLVRFDRAGEMSAAAHMDRSHVDEGWIKKWGQSESPVNFFGQGYLAAALAAINGLPIGSYKVMETASIVSGAECSRFTLVRA